MNNILSIGKTKQDLLRKKRKISAWGIKLKIKKEFFNNLSSMMRSGLGIGEAMNILVDQSTGNFKKILQEISESVSTGQPLSVAMSFYPRVFSAFMVNTVKAGEASGNLDNNLENIAEQISKETKLISTIRQAMFYPLIVLGLSFVMAMLLSLFVLPKIMPIFIGLKVDLPTSTRFLIWFSAFTAKYALAIVVFTVIFIIFLSWLWRQKWIKPITHYLFLHILIIKRISRAKNLAQMSRTLGTMLQSGVSIDEALQITRLSLANFYYRRSLNNIYKKIKQGYPLSEAFSFESDLFPKLLLSLLKIGEKTGNLEKEFFHLADIYEHQVDEDSQLVSTAVEPLLLVLIGLVVGWLAISIITPIYQVTGNIYH